METFRNSSLIEFGFQKISTINKKQFNEQHGKRFLLEIKKTWQLIHKFVKYSVKFLTTTINCYYDAWLLWLLVEEVDADFDALSCGDI